MLRLVLCALLLLFEQSDAFAAKKAVKSKKPKAKASSGGGFGSAAATTKAGPTPAQLLTKSVQQFDSIEKMRNEQNNDEAEEQYGEGSDGASTDAEPSTSVTKWCIVLRSSASTEFSDWVPVALMALACGPDLSDPTELVPSALGACVREVVEGAGQAQPALRKVGRESLEYAFEPLDSFETHVYEGLQGRAERRGEASKTLGLEGGASAGEVKRAHRKLMMELHPDRFVGDEEGAKAASERMLEVQEAYAELGGGQGASGSFYASIGGKARVSFSGMLAKEALVPMGKPRAEQELPLDAGGWRAGIAPMSTPVLREFVMRNTMREKDAE